MYYVFIYNVNKIIIEKINLTLKILNRFLLFILYNIPNLFIIFKKTPELYKKMDN